MSCMKIEALIFPTMYSIVTVFLYSVCWILQPAHKQSKQPNYTLTHFGHKVVVIKVRL